MAEPLDVEIPLIHKCDIVLEEVPIGRGGFGTVYRGRHNLFGLVAVKTLIDNGLLPQKHTKALQQEAKKLLEVCHHPNILNIYGVIMEKDNYSLILEYMPLGSLSEFRKEFTVRWPLMVQILKDVITGMEFLHQKNPPVYHLDLKADNVLLEGQVHAKLCDFGLSEWKTVTVNVNRNMDKTGRRCTTSHLPPEVWGNVNRAPDSYYDVYSFGIVVWEMLSGAVPFGSQSDDIIRSAVLTGQRPDFTLFPKDTPPALSGIMTRCWHQKPKQRPTFTALKAEVEKLFTGQYERHLISSLKLLRQEITQNYDINDPIRTSTAIIDTLQEPVIEAVPVPMEPQMETGPGAPAGTATENPQQQEAPNSQPTQEMPENVPIEVKPFKLDADLELHEKQIRQMLRDPIAMRLAKTKYIQDIYNISEKTQNIFNDPVQLNRIIESDADLKWQLYYAKTEIKPNMSGKHLDMARHRAKAFYDINKNDLERVFRPKSNRDSYSYRYNNENSKTEREKRLERVDECQMKHPYLKDILTGDRYYRLKKALENPQHLQQTMRENTGTTEAPTGLSALKLTTIDPEVIEIAKDPLLLLTLLREKDDIRRKLAESYPDLLCELLANAKRKISLPSGGFIDPPRKSPRELMEQLEKELKEGKIKVNPEQQMMMRDVMMGRMDPDYMMMMDMDMEMDMHHRMRRYNHDSDSDEDEYMFPGMHGHRRKLRMMREMSDLRPLKMEAMMRKMGRPSMSMYARAAMMEPELSMAMGMPPMASSSGLDKKEKEAKEMKEKQKGIMGMLKKAFGGNKESDKKKDEDDKDDQPKKSGSRSIGSSATKTSSSSSLSSSSSGSPSSMNPMIPNITIPDISIPRIDCSIPNISARMSAPSSISSAAEKGTSSTSKGTTPTPTTTDSKTTSSTSSTSTSSTSAPSATASSSVSNPVSNPGNKPAVPKVGDINEVTVPKVLYDDLEIDTVPSMEPMEVDPAARNRSSQPATSSSSSSSSGNPVNRPTLTPSTSGSQQQTESQVRSRPQSDNTTPPPSEPKKSKPTTMETDAQPSMEEASAATPQTVTSKKDGSHTIEHHHGGDIKTFLTWDAKAAKPNIQVGDKNFMVISDSGSVDMDPWGSGPMPQRGRKERKKKEVVLTTSTRLVTAGELDEVASHLGSDFRKLRRPLGMSDAIIEQIELDYHREGQQEITYQILRKWKEMKGSMATIAALAEALRQINRIDMAQRLK